MYIYVYARLKRIQFLFHNLKQQEMFELRNVSSSSFLVKVTRICTCTCTCTCMYTHDTPQSQIE